MHPTEAEATRDNTFTIDVLAAIRVNHVVKQVLQLLDLTYRWRCLKVCLKCRPDIQQAVGASAPSRPRLHYPARACGQTR